LFLAGKERGLVPEFWLAEGESNTLGKPRAAHGFAFLPPACPGAFGFAGTTEGDGMQRIGVIGAVLEQPTRSQAAFNETVAAFRGIIKGRMGIPFDDAEVSVISLVVSGELDDINALTGRLGSLPNVTVKTAISGGR
jgi:putative iron-only hydrogenase system regulator